MTLGGGSSDTHVVFIQIPPYTKEEKRRAKIHSDFVLGISDFSG
jgi:hypothetical protein